MNASVVVALITAGFALLGSIIAGVLSWHGSRGQYNAKIVEMKLSYLTEKRKILGEQLNSTDVRIDTKLDGQAVQKELGSFDLHRRKLAACLALLPEQGAHALRGEENECLYEWGMAFKTGKSAGEIVPLLMRTLEFNSAVNALIQQELIKTTHDIESTIQFRR